MLGSLVIRTKKPPPPAPVRVCPETIKKLLSEKSSGSQGDVFQVTGIIEGIFLGWKSSIPGLFLGGGVERGGGRKI